MKIISWNCNGAFRKKYSQIIQEHADLYIIQESENPQLYPKEFEFLGKNYIFLAFEGDKKGILVFSFTLHRIEREEQEHFQLRYYLPFIFQKRKFLAIWAKDNYIEDIYIYFRIHRESLAGRCIIGDFNSNVKWNKKHKYRSHSHINEMLEEEGLISAYHTQTKEKFGEETQATYYMYRKLSSPYHIDYAYLPKVENYKLSVLSTDYLQFSDHVPLLLAME